jgi:hypothetical protein
MVAKRALRGTEPLGFVKPVEPELCPLGGRVLEPGASVDEHHLVPKSKGGKTKSLIHRICRRVQVSCCRPIRSASWKT